METSAVGSPKYDRKETDYDDFWAENGIKGSSKPENSGFAGQRQQQSQPSQSSTRNVSGAKGKDDEWENW